MTARSLRALTTILITLGALSVVAWPSSPQAMETTAPGPVAGAPVTRVESLGRHAGFWQSSPPRISVRQCLDYCIQWYGPCNSPSDLWALDCKINRDRCEARCFGR